MFGEIFSIIAPTFACAALGWFWSRSGRRWDQETLTEIIASIGAPCLVFSQLSALEVPGSVLLSVAAAMILALLAFGVIGSLVLAGVGLPRNTFLSPLVFANNGNMGIPLCLFAFGSEGLAIATCVFAVVAIAHFTVGIWIWEDRISFGGLLRTPLSWAAALAVLVLTFEIPVPRWIQSTTSLLGQLTIPLMLISLGVSIANLRTSALPRTVALSVLRMGMGFAVGVGLTLALGLEGVARQVVILQCTMPVAVFNYLFAQRYDRAPHEVGSLVVVSTALSFGVLPLLLAWLL